MTSIILNLFKQDIINPPKFFTGNLCYEVIGGSHAYGCNEEGKADQDIISIVLPPKNLVFPHLSGEILGFDMQTNRFESYQQHHIKANGKEYDVSAYSIIRFFRLVASGSPNLLEILYVNPNLITYSSHLGQHIRDNRRLFLSKKLFYTLKSYAFAQLHKVKTNKRQSSEARKELVEKFGFDTKFAFNIVRLVNQCEQIFREGDLDLQRDREQYKSIRRGDWKLEEIEEYFKRKEKILDELYHTSTAIPDKIRETEIKQLLVDCLEMHYGNLSNIIYIQNKEDKFVSCLKDIRKVIDSVL